MEKETKLDYCLTCKQRQQCTEVGLTCQVSGQRPDASIPCQHFKEDVYKEELYRDSEIRGLESTLWRGFFDFIIHFIIPEGVILTFVWQYLLYGGFGNVPIISYILLMPYLFFGVYSVIAIHLRKPDAVFSYRCFFLYVIWDRLVGMLLIILLSSGANLVYIISSLVFGLLCFVYPIFTRDFDFLVPKQKRKPSLLTLIMAGLGALALCWVTARLVYFLFFV